jgi:hypothetical protein
MVSLIGSVAPEKSTMITKGFFPIDYISDTTTLVCYNRIVPYSSTSPVSLIEVIGQHNDKRVM